MLPCFERMGKTVVHQGAPGAGQHTKLVNQTLIAANMVGVCEALLYGHKAGLDLNTVLKSVSTGAAGSKALEVLAPRILKGDFEPGFFVEHFIKDMSIALDEAHFALEFQEGMVASWELKGSEGRTHLTFVQSGFDTSRPPYGPWLGWLSGFADLKRMLEVPNWRPMWHSMEMPGLPEGALTLE